ncbi:MAG: hypothetical protein M3348_01260 [Acidobacteriota bacterium]|nr:hypothetical protein [Acidobacteriota bacterium]
MKAEDGGVSEESILAASEKLFSDGKGVRRYSHSGLRYVKLPGDAVLVGRNPRKGTRWAEMVRKGRKVAWAIRGDEYIARVTDGEVEMLGHRSDE